MTDFSTRLEPGLPGTKKLKKAKFLIKRKKAKRRTICGKKLYLKLEFDKILQVLLRFFKKTGLEIFSLAFKKAKKWLNYFISGKQF
jgi:hypothetical protein